MLIFGVLSVVFRTSDTVVLSNGGSGGRVEGGGGGPVVGLGGGLGVEGGTGRMVVL